LLSVQVTEAERMVSQWVGNADGSSASREPSSVDTAKAATGVA
jgi:hypothetical protein